MLHSQAIGICKIVNIKHAILNVHKEHNLKKESKLVHVLFLANLTTVAQVYIFHPTEHSCILTNMRIPNQVKKQCVKGSLHTSHCD